MNKLLAAIEKANPKYLFWGIVSLAIVLAAQMQAIQHGWINPDSVLYFESAKLIAAGDWHGAYKIFPWPFYSICIAAVHQLTSLSIHMSAQLLNMLFFGIATASFLKIIEYAGGKNTALVCGALLLFSNQYIIGDVLEMLMRDEGFWAFFLTSLVFFIRYYQDEKTSDAILWQLSAILSVLFRIEAISFLLFLPFVILLSKKSKLSIKFLKAYAINILILSTIAIAIANSNTLTIENFGRLSEVFSTRLWQELTEKITTQAQVMSTNVLGNYLDEFAMPGLILTLIYALLSKIVTSTGIISVSLAGMHIKDYQHFFKNDVWRVLFIAAIIALFNSALIITKTFILSSRYVVALAFILTIFAALYFAYALKQTAQAKKPYYRWLISTLVLILCLCFVKNILPKKTGYNYMQDAVAWVNEINSNHKPVFYNDSRARFYAGERFAGASTEGWLEITTAINNQSVNQYDFLLISLESNHLNDQHLLADNLPNHKLVKEYANHRNKKKMLIFARK